MNADQPSARAYRFDRFVLDLRRGDLRTAGGTELPLRPKSFALLQLLVENAGRLLDRDTIMETLWPDVFVTDDSISQCIRDIRRAFGTEAQSLLRTVPRRGYLLAAEVMQAGSAEQPHGEAPSSASKAAMPPPSLAAVGGNEAQDSQACIGNTDVDADQDAALDLTGLDGREPLPGPERRHLTVLVCDLSDSTSPFEGMDPEDARVILQATMERCAAVIARCGGYVATYTGDGIMAYFGYPNAREDAAERAVHAGLALVEALGAPDPQRRPGVQLRVGIATGLVVNDCPRLGTQGQLAVGRPLGVATKLQALAAPGSVVVANGTRSLLGGLFNLEDLGNHVLKGFAEPERAWRVVGEGMAESRFEALRGPQFVPLVGRNQELSLLLDRWRQAVEGEGQAVMLAGEPGIGKSRLVQSLREELFGEPHAYLGYYCSPFRQDSALWPVIAHFRRAAGLGFGEDEARGLAKLEALLLQRDDGMGQSVPLVASLLSLPYEVRYPPLDMPPPKQRERTLVELVDQLTMTAANRPVLLVWEDVHWADATSLELVEIVLDRLQGLPVLAVVSFRPEFSPPWHGQSHATWLRLSRLGRRRCGELISGVSGGKALPAAVVDGIMDKADGVPLFVEELTKAVLESGLAWDWGDSPGHRDQPPLAIPETLQDSLMGRLGRHAQAKELAQVGSVIGREFSHELLAAATSWDGRDLADALRHLISAELILLRGTGAEAAYVFKHALVRDAAYASLLKGKRRLLHARIAEVLEDRFLRTTDADPEVLAHHWAEAGEASKAALHRLRAGERAAERSATAEAIAQFTAGLDMLPSLPIGPERDDRELDLQVALGAVLAAAKGLAAPEAERAYVQARDLCDRLGEGPRLVPVLLGLWASHNARDELAAAHTIASQLLELARRKRDRVAAILGHRALGATLFGLGRFADARAQLEELLSLGGMTAGLSRVSLPYDPCVSGRAWLALALAVLGSPDQALGQSDKALADAGKLRHHNTTCLVLSLRCSVGQLLRDEKDVARNADALLTVAGEQGFAYWVGLGQYFRGWAQAWAGDTTAGIEQTHRALEACRMTGAMAYVPYNLATLAELCLRAGDPARGRKLLDTALGMLETTDARYCEAELLRLDGELRLAMPDPDWNGAEAAFKHALEIARDQEAKTVELRVAMSLAHLWADGGKRQQARDMLASIYNSFIEGFSSQLLAIALRMIDDLD